MAEDKLGLEVVIDQLREELLALTRTANDKDFRFALESVEVELHVGVTREGGGNAKAKFWVLELDAGGKYARESTQTIKLTLKPRVEGLPAGSEVPIGRDDRTS